MNTTPVSNRYDFVLLYDVSYGNPNGDPDAGNMPRIDTETGVGLITDVCIKRKIRNYVDIVASNQPGYRLYIRKDAPLRSSDAEALSYLGVNADKESIKEAKKTNKDLDIQVRDFMCQNFFDIRAFGAVMTTFTEGGLNCGQVRGPVQIGFSRSVDPIMPQDITITRMAITKEEDAKNKQNEMGHKYIVPYGLYRCEGTISASLAQKVTGFNEDDLELLWEAILNMFDFDRASARGRMALRKLVIFRHESAIGNAPAHKLYDLVTVERKPDVDYPRKFEDYTFAVNMDELPAGVSCEIRE